MSPLSGFPLSMAPIPRPEDSGQMNPGDEAPAGTPDSGENICPECHGTGKIAGQGECRNCGGTGKIVQVIGGA